MKKLIKLIILILISSSVYFIYQKTNHSKSKIVFIGDFFLTKSLEELKTNPNIEIITYQDNDQTIHETLSFIKNNPTIKKELLEANSLILNLGYNDYIIKSSLKEHQILNNNILEEIQLDLKNLLIEIEKYYKKPILIIGYSSQEASSINSILQEQGDLFIHPKNKISTNHLLLNQEEKSRILEEIKKILEKEQII